MRKETQQLVARSRHRNILVVGPMDVLGVKDSVAEVRRVMEDGVHLNKRALGTVMDHVLTRVEDFLVARKKGPNDRGMEAGKRVRQTGSLGDGGPFRGRGGGRGGTSGSYGGHGGSWRGGRSSTYF